MHTADYGLWFCICHLFDLRSSISAIDCEFRSPEVVSGNFVECDPSKGFLFGQKGLADAESRRVMHLLDHDLLNVFASCMYADCMNAA